MKDAILLLMGTSRGQDNVCRFIEAALPLSACLLLFVTVCVSFFLMIAHANLMRDACCSDEIFWGLISTSISTVIAATQRTVSSHHARLSR